MEAHDLQTTLEVKESILGLMLIHCSSFNSGTTKPDVVSLICKDYRNFRKTSANIKKVVIGMEELIQKSVFRPCQPDHNLK